MNRNFFNSSATIKVVDEADEHLLFANSQPDEEGGGKIILTGLTKSTLYKNDFLVTGEKVRVFLLPSTIGKQYYVSTALDDVKNGENVRLTLVPVTVAPNKDKVTVSRPSDEPNRIDFYSTFGDEKYKGFSNFSYHQIKIFGKTWKTSEHAFQAQKLVNKEDIDEVFNAKTPSEAARIGRDRKRQIRKDWESVKVGLMYQIVRAKFTQHHDLRELLLSTNDAYLSEHTKNDKFWGDGGDDSGKNMLGQILMMIREEIKD